MKKSQSAFDPGKNAFADKDHRAYELITSIDVIDNPANLKLLNF